MIVDPKHQASEIQEQKPRFIPSLDNHFPEWLCVHHQKIGQVFTQSHQNLVSSQNFLKHGPQARPPASEALGVSVKNAGLCTRPQIQ